MSMLPRLIRLRDIPKYLGVNINYFNQNVRPHVQELRIGVQGIAFDRLDLDAWVDQYKGMGGRFQSQERKHLWERKEHQGSISEMEYGTSTKQHMESEFAKALEQARSKKRKAT